MPTVRTAVAIAAGACAGYSQSHYALWPVSGPVPILDLVKVRTPQRFWCSAIGGGSYPLAPHQCSQRRQCRPGAPGGPHSDVPPGQSGNGTRTCNSAKAKRIIDYVFGVASAPVTARPHQ